jgi:hypothetical protein
MDSKEIDYALKGISFLKAKVALYESHIAALEANGDNLAFALGKLNPDSSYAKSVIKTWEKFRGEK